MRWADERVAEALRQNNVDRESPEATLYAHIVAAERVWLWRIRGMAEQPPVWPRLSLEECEQLGRANVEGFEELLAGLTTGEIDRPINYRNSAGAEFTSGLEDILIHVAMHGSYHRGQIATMLRGGGGTPASTDYIAFVRGAPAATRGG